MSSPSPVPAAAGPAVATPPAGSSVPSPTAAGHPVPVGSHVPVSGGLARTALPYADRIGAGAVQVFVANPRGWAMPEGDPRQDEAFRQGCAERGLPAFVHAPYLVNLGSPTPVTLERSVASLRHSLHRAMAIGAAGVVVHTGSAVAGARYETALAQVGAALLPLLDEVEDAAAAHGVADGPYLLLEPTAGQGRSLCATVDQLDPYLDVLERHPRVGVCLDTCHAFAAGHDLDEPGGADRLLTALVAAAGPGRLRLVHANDSMDARGAARDRHERIGRGRIGAAAFAELFAHPLAAGVPWVIETPGEGPADYRRDITLLTLLRDGVPVEEAVARADAAREADAGDGR